MTIKIGGLKSPPIFIVYSLICRLFHFISKLSAGFKFNHLASCDFNSFFSTWVDTCAGTLLCNGESAETNERYLVTFCESIADGCYSCVKRSLRL